MHRCASTTMQNLLRVNRPVLAERGIGVVLRADMKTDKRLDMRAWHRRAKANPRSWGAAGGFISAVEQMPYGHVIVSEESLLSTMPAVRARSFYPYMEKFIGRIQALKEHFDLRLRFVVRRQDRFVNSVYAFRLGVGLAEDFDTFLTSFPEGCFNWCKITNALDRQGLADISHVAVMDDWQGRVLNRELADLVGLETEGLTLRSRGNPSLPTSSLPLLLAINRAGLMPARAERRAGLLPLLSKMTEPDLGAVATMFTVKDTAKIEQYYDPHAPVGFTDEARAAFVTGYEPVNAQFLNHAVVSAPLSIWD